MESIIAIVGFLGAGKTTLLTHLVERYRREGWAPFVVLNDYENADLDAQQLTRELEAGAIRALNGSCICCSGIAELRETVNRIPERPRGITLIEANGTSDACSLMGFLGVGLHPRFEPPVQISVVDAKNWQRRARGLSDVLGTDHNELEANQVQVSSLVVLTHLEGVSEARRREVEASIRALNPHAPLTTMAALDVELLPRLEPSRNEAAPLEHGKAHWASCSIDLPDVPSLWSIQAICDAIPSSVLRVKGCTIVADADHLTFFERTPDGEVYVRPYRGKPITGPKLLVVGPGSGPAMLEAAVQAGRSRPPPEDWPGG